MISRSEKTVKIIIELNESEAEKLKLLVQNDLMFQNPGGNLDLEPSDWKQFRQDIWDAMEINGIKSL